MSFLTRMARVLDDVLGATPHYWGLGFNSRRARR